MNNEVKITAMIVACIVIMACSMIGGGYYYNLKTNQVYANLLRASQDPLAVRCAWTGDQQVCNIVGLARR